MMVVGVAQEKSCRIVQDRGRVELWSPQFCFRLDIASGLIAVSWQNLLTGQEINLGNSPELQADLDISRQRIDIVGWKAVHSQSGCMEPNQEHGYNVEAYLPEHDDSTWESRVTPIPKYDPERPVFYDYTWARTHVFLPESISDQPISLVLGSNGIYDYRYTRVFVNGHEAGVHRFDTRWHEPACFDLDTVRQHVRFGQDNVIAVQLSGLVTRTQRLNDLDPQQTRLITHKFNWPMQYEQYLVIGKRLETPVWSVTDTQVAHEGTTGEVVFRLDATSPTLSATVRYWWNATESVFHKRIEIENTGTSAVRLLHLRAGRYVTGMSVSEGEQGFPVYIDDQFFVGLTHPAGWVTGQDETVLLQQHPGKTLQTGECFIGMEAVLGVSQVDQARSAFLQYLRSRMRRTVRKHDRAYAIFDCFASWPSEEYWGGTEEYFLSQIKNVVAPQKRVGCDYDIYCIELWIDRAGDLICADPKRFPQGFATINRKLGTLGINLGLWFDSSWWEWTIGRNPVTGPARGDDGSYGAGSDLANLCRATDPVRTMYTTAFIHHLRSNGLRLVKLDNLLPICYNPRHEHLPGIYSTEAIMNAIIDTLERLDRESPELFIMLYWGHHSPWWLLWGDTLFEPGLQIEASSPAATPSLYVRDSVTVGLDQAQWYAEDIPPLGKDSLGVWLSTWPWNSGIGKERWQEGFVMDICRGSLLAQPWSDNGCLTPAEQQQMATFIELLKARPDCFGNPRFIYGNPWHEEPYGYLCSNGQRAFVAINNCSWQDRGFDLQLGSTWCLPEGKSWNLYRWYPDPARLTTDADAFGSVTVNLRPYEIALLEVVPADETPTLGRRFGHIHLERALSEPSQEIRLYAAPGTTVASLPQDDQTNEVARRNLTINCQVPASVKGGILVVATQLRQNGSAVMLGDVGNHFAAQAIVADQPAHAIAIVPQRTYATPWQGWRIEIKPATKAQQVELGVSAAVPDNVELIWEGHFIPTD